MDMSKAYEAHREASVDNVEYFRKKYADISAECRLDRLLLFIYALGGGPQTVEWVQTLPIAEMLLADNEWGLRACFDHCLSPKIPRKAFMQMLEIPGVSDHLAECILSIIGA
jgi:hypothetical protein